MRRTSILICFLAIALSVQAQKTFVLPDVQKPHQIAVDGNDLYLFDEADYSLHIYTISPFALELKLGKSEDVEKVLNRPLLHQYCVSENKIYATTYKKENDKTEMIILDLKGDILRRLFLPLSSIQPKRGVLRFDLFPKLPSMNKKTLIEK